MDHSDNSAQARPLREYNGRGRRPGRRPSGGEHCAQDSPPTQETQSTQPNNERQVADIWEKANAWNLKSYEAAQKSTDILHKQLAVMTSWFQEVAILNDRLREKLDASNEEAAALKEQVREACHDARSGDDLNNNDLDSNA